MPFLSRLLGSLLFISGNKVSRVIAFRNRKTVIRTARPHKHTLNRIKSISAEKKAYSAFFECSLTVEAAFLLPMFAFAVCILAYPLKIIDAEIRYQSELEKMTGNMSVVSYLEGTAEDLIGENISRYSGMVSGAVTAADAIGAADREILGIPVPLKIKLPDEKSDMIEISVMTYSSFPFCEVLGVEGISSKFISVRRAWTGREGGAGRAYGTDERASETENDEEDITVWVAENASVSRRYHLSENCHYISNTVTAVPASSVSSLRSADGKKYKPCSSCRPENDGTVFIFRSGNSYHASAECGAVQSYAAATTRSEAEERGFSPCSYCLSHYR